MLPISVECRDCGESRLGHLTGDGISVNTEQCRECGATDWTVNDRLQYLLDS